MMEEYHIEWKKINKWDILSARIDTLIFGIFLIIIGGIFLHYLLLLNVEGIVVWLTIFLFVLSIFLYRKRLYKNLKKFTFIKYIKINKNGIIYETAAGKRFVAKFDNFGVIYATKRVMGSAIRKYYKLPQIIFVYYNEKHNRCFQIYIERRVGEKIIKRYKEYERERGIKECPIFIGDLKDPSEILIPVKKLMKSEFCHRRR